MKIDAELLPRQWRITLKSGRTLGLWADGYGTVGDNYVFEIMVDATPEERADPNVRVMLHGWAEHPERTSIAVATIPVAEVDKIATARWDD